tara:strand:+ start:1234 stop:1977 length:744 start_codon:yes stop_codon:yes gene_type:complete
MKTSVVIPSTNDHFKYLDKVFLSYVKQTVRPEEIVVSLANSHLVNEESIETLKSKYKEYFENIEVITHNKVVPEGPNRGEGTKVASNELIMYNDSDDLAHPQRVEIVTKAFERHEINHLNHSYSFDKHFSPITEVKDIESQEIFNLHFPSFVDWEQKDRVRSNRPKNFFGVMAPIISYGGGFGVAITGGSLCILKSVTDTIEWDWEMEVSYDYDFCMDTLFYFNRSLLIDSPLIWYNRIGNMEWYNV